MLHGVTHNKHLIVLESFPKTCFDTLPKHVGQLEEQGAMQASGHIP